MRRPPALSSYIEAAGALILAAAVAVDARRSFDLLHPTPLILVLGLSAVMVLHAASRWAREGRRLPPARVAAVWLALAAAGLSVNALALHGKEAGLRDSWRADQEESLVRRAEALQARFAEILDLMEEPMARARNLATRNPATGGPGGVAAAFDTIDLLVAGRPAQTPRLGVTIYRPGGQALAWAGACSPVPPELLARTLPAGSTRWLAVDESGTTRLVALAKPWPEPPFVVSVELTARSIYDDRVQSTLFGAELFDSETDRIVLSDYRRPPLDLAELFASEGNILAVTGSRVPAVHVALDAPDGSLLGHATLSGQPYKNVESALLEEHSSAGTLIVLISGLVLLGWIILPRPPPEETSAFAEARRQGARILALWGFRLLLAEFPPKIEILGQNLGEPSLFARSGSLGLLGSPLDFLLTSLAIISTGVLISVAGSRILTSTAAYRRTLALAALAGCMLLAFVLGSYLPSQAQETVRNTLVDILTVRPLELAPARILLQSSAVFSLAGFLIPLVTLGWTAVWASATKRGGGPPPPPSPTETTVRWLALLVVPSTVAACLLLEMTLQPAATLVLKSFVEDNLAVLVRAMPSLRRLDLKDAVETVSSQPGLADRIETALPSQDPTLAYELWSLTPLAIRGNASSLTVRDAEGSLLSRFSMNFPPTLDKGAGERERIRSGTIAEFAAGPLRRQIQALHAHGVVERNGVLVGTITIHLRHDFGDIPPLTPPTPFERAMRDEPPISPLLPSWSPSMGLAVYSKDGVPVLASPRDPPAPPPRQERERILSDFREDLWQTSDESGFRTHTYFFSSASHLVALSFSDPSFLGRLARAIRLSIQSLFWLLALVSPWVIASAVKLGWRPDPGRLVLAATRTHYRRLVSGFLLASLAPLTLLAFALTEFVSSEVQQDVVERGWTILETAKRQVEALSVLSGVEGPPDDGALFSLTQEGGDELSLFTSGNLAAASNREMYDTRVLPLRLDGEIRRQISLEGRRVVQGTLRAGGREYPTINGVVSLGLAGEGVLSVLLVADNPQAARRAQQVYDALLITSASVVLVMGILAYVLARRIAAPIRRLSGAAARIATGNLDTSVDITTRDETGDLIASFNAMARALRHQRDDLEQRGNYIAKILLNATTGVVSVDFTGKIVTMNPAAVAILGIEKSAPGQDLVALLSERNTFHALARTLRECLASPGASREVESEIGPEGEPRHARARVVPFTEGGGLLIFLDDVTETIRSNRLAAWAEMARRIAHEIKNPLTPIKLSADHIRRVYEDGSTSFPAVLEECLRTINEQVANLRAISGQFSIYARHQEMRKERTGIREFMEEVIRPYKIAPPAGVSLETDLDGVPEAMEIDRTMISQAIVNLLENSLQAMPDGGTLMIRASAVGRPGKRELEIVIADTGVGMSREELARAFEPYFSTKVTGTGLGMAIARRAVEEHHGRIELTSAPSQGTTAKIVIPMA